MTRLKGQRNDRQLVPGVRRGFMVGVRKRVQREVGLWSLQRDSGRVGSIKRLRVERLKERTKIPEYINTTRIDLLGLNRGTKFQLTDY